MGSVGKSLFGADNKAYNTTYDDMGYKDLYGESPLNKDYIANTANQIADLNNKINNGQIDEDSELWKSKIKSLQNEANKQANSGMVNLSRLGLSGSGDDTTDRTLASVNSNLQNSINSARQDELQNMQATMQNLINNYNIPYNQQMQQAQMQNQVNQANAQQANNASIGNSQSISNLTSSLLSKL